MQQELEKHLSNKSCQSDTKYIFYLLVTEYCNIILNMFFCPNVNKLHYIFPFSKIFPSFPNRPGFLLSRPICLHAIAPSVGKILKLIHSYTLLRGYSLTTSFLTSFQAISNSFFFGSRLSKVVLQWWIEFLPRQTSLIFMDLAQNV